MVLDWLAKGKAAGLPELLARKQFGKAVELAQAQHDAQPRDGRLRLQLADTLIAAGRGREAVPLLREMADELAAEGFAAKAIAVLKRIRKIDPGRMDIERRLASLIADRARRDTAAPRPPAPAAPPHMPEFGMEEIGDEGLDLEAPLRPARRAPALFPDFSDEELVAVMGGLRLVEFKAGDLVVSEGEPGDSLFLVTTGIVAGGRDSQGLNGGFVGHDEDAAALRRLAVLGVARAQRRDRLLDHRGDARGALFPHAAARPRRKAPDVVDHGQELLAGAVDSLEVVDGAFLVGRGGVR